MSHLQMVTQQKNVEHLPAENQVVGYLIACQATVPRR